MTQSHPFTNRLIREKSPYLLQHAHNPVDWYPWGQEAFEEAVTRDCPVFLSIGYATCHWCHVMAKESFENPEVAKLMNESFVNVKVDREELPEVDALYMEMAQSMLSGAAGWPLNIILTPQLQPFFAITYLPPKSNHGLTGLFEMIHKINDIWKGEEREHVLEQAESIVQTFSANIPSKDTQISDVEIIHDAAEMFFKMADPIFGGVKGAPKFPVGYQWNFLLNYAVFAEDSRSLFLVEKTLDMMHRGGIYDQIGGGFSRYSTDESWLVPHFEKMLYDNALLAHSYLQTYLVTQEDLYRSTCQEIVNYVLRDMTHEKGAFFSAEDSDSAEVEGAFYTWSLDEIVNILEIVNNFGKSESELFCEFYGVTAAGNFHGKNILHTPLSLKEFAEKKAIDPLQLQSLFSNQKETLLQVRNKRIRPFKDDKVLTSWNGLMIFAMAEVGASLDNTKALHAAINAAEFIRNNMYRDGHLLRRWRDGEALYEGTLEDHAFLIRGLISLFEAGEGFKWLQWALELTETLRLHFKNEDGAFFQTRGNDKNIIIRKTHFSDTAEPSGNAIHCENLLKLYQLTSDEQYLSQAEEIFKAADPFINRYPPGYCYHLINLLRYYDKHGITVVVALNEQEDHREEILKLLYHRFIPNRAVIWRAFDDKELFEIIPFTQAQGPLNGKTTLYVCDRAGVCDAPLVELSDMIIAVQRRIYSQ